MTAAVPDEVLERRNPRVFKFTDDRTSNVHNALYTLSDEGLLADVIVTTFEALIVGDALALGPASSSAEYVIIELELLERIKLTVGDTAWEDDLGRRYRAFCAYNPAPARGVAAL